MLTFSEIEKKLEDGAAAVKDHASHIFHSGVLEFAAEIKDVEAKAKAEALVAVKDATPEIQAAVQVAVEGFEKALLAAIQARLA